MPKSTEPTETPEAADAAVEEVTAKPDGLVSFTFNDHEYTFKRKRLSAMQFRLPMQKRRDAEAIEWLLGAGFEQFLILNSDEDGCTDESVYGAFLEEMGKALGSGNS